jgi:hypothetical protein
MKTGEGKTLAATMPVYLNALTGLGVHVVTVNDNHARRDAEWMSPIYSIWTAPSATSSPTWIPVPGRLVRLRHHLRDQQRVRFDYLRDNMAEHITSRCASLLILYRGRGRLDSDRRSPHPVIISGGRGIDQKVCRDPAIVPRLTGTRPSSRTWTTRSSS